MAHVVAGAAGDNGRGKAEFVPHADAQPIGHVIPLEFAAAISHINTAVGQDTVNIKHQKFDFIKGGTGSLNFSTSVFDANLESSMTIIGEKGSIKVGGQYMNEVQYCHIQDYTMPELPPSLPANDYGHYKGSAANHHFVIENVVNTLKGRTVATTNALEGLKVVEIIEKIYALK